MNSQIAPMIKAPKPKKSAIVLNGLENIVQAKAFKIQPRIIKVMATIKFLFCVTFYKVEIFFKCHIHIVMA